MPIPRTLHRGITSRWRVVKAMSPLPFTGHRWVAVAPGLPVQLGVPHASHEAAIRYAQRKAEATRRAMEHVMEVCS